LSTLFLGFIRKLCLVTALLGSANSHAGLIVDSGELLGATGIEVAGVGIFDVSFADGSCAELFSGCDELSDFAFINFDQVRAASQALLDQVFIDSDLGLFDSTPALTRGCEDDNKCISFIPYKFLDNWVMGKTLINANNESDDKHSWTTNLGIGQSLNYRSNTTFAIFTKVEQVATPATALLFSLAFIALVSFRRRT